MPEEALCLVIVNKAKILEIDYTVTIAIIPALESAQSHNGPLVPESLSPITLKEGLRPLLSGQSLQLFKILNNIGKIYTD